MKIMILLCAAAFLMAAAGSAGAQVAPNVNGDKDLRDTDLKRRSAEMDRIEREAKKNELKPVAKTEEDRLAAKFEEIKIDFEQIQKSQDTVISTYRTGRSIDFALIGKSAREINGSALRLRANVFPETPAKKDKTESKSESKSEPAKRPELRQLIVDLDVAIGRFITSPMFADLRVVDTEEAKKAALELEKIIALSALLETEAQAKAGGK